MKDISFGMAWLISFGPESLMIGFFIGMVFSDVRKFFRERKIRRKQIEILRRMIEMNIHEWQGTPEEFKRDFIDKQVPRHLH